MINSEIFRIINEILRKYNLHDLIKIELKNIVVNNGKYVTFRDKRKYMGTTADGFNRTKIIPSRPFNNYFKYKSKDRQNDQGILYHFIKIENCKKLLIDNHLYLNSLNYHLINDPFEYDELLNITNPYDKQNYKTNKDEIYIYCFTKDFRDITFWETYGTCEENKKIENIAIAFRFKRKVDFYELMNAIELRDVIYNLGNEFDFIKEIQIIIYSKFNKILHIDSDQYFTRFFKREKFEWEKEIRLCVDFNVIRFLEEINEKYPGSLLFDFNKSMTRGKNDENQNVLLIPIENELFELEICELICGPDIQDDDFEFLKMIAINKNIRIWKYA